MAIWNWFYWVIWLKGSLDCAQEIRQISCHLKDCWGRHDPMMTHLGVSWQAPLSSVAVDCPQGMPSETERGRSNLFHGLVLGSGTSSSSTLPPEGSHQGQSILMGREVCSQLFHIQINCIFLPLDELKQRKILDIDHEEPS